MTQDLIEETYQVRGSVQAGYEPVADAFVENLAERGEVGAGCAVRVGGELVVELVGGLADPTEGRPYDEHTLQLVFSTTKGIAAMVVHQLVAEGLIDVEAPVASVWPEFAAAGKDQVTIAMLLDHQAGLSGVEAELTLDDVLAFTPVADALAAQAPAWEPGTAHGYHALTYGWLVGEVVQRVTGRPIGELVAERLAEPLGLDLWIGLPDEHHDRVAPLLASRPEETDLAALSAYEPEMIQKLAAAFMDRNSPTNRALLLNGILMRGPSGGMVWNEPPTWRASIPAANGITNARSLATLYSSCVTETDGVRVLDDDTVANAIRERSSGPDRTLIMNTRFGLGFMLASDHAPLLGGRSFGHPGAGGSLGAADPDRGIGFGYVMNKMRTNIAADPRAGALLAAVDRCAP